MAVRESTIPNGLVKVSIFIWILIIFISGFVPAIAQAAYEHYAPGDTAVIGEFVYDDDFVATTTPCTVSIYNPSGTLIVNSASMTADLNGWHYYNYSIPSIGPEGTWPSTMTCGSVPVGDLVRVDKTFVVGNTYVASSTIATSVWSNATRSLTSFGSLVSDIWNNGTRTLTGAGLDSGSLATLANIESASSSLYITLPTSVWANPTRSLTTFGTLAADVWANGTRTLTSGGVTAISTDVWSFATRRLSDGTLDTGVLATLSDVNNASTSVVALVNANTDTQTSGITSAVNSNTNSAVLSASTSLGAAITNASTSVVTAINLNTNSQISSAISTINNNTDSRVLTASSSLASTIPTAVWANVTRSLTTFGTLTADVWNVATSTFLTAGSVGEHIVTTLDAPVSGVTGGSSITASDVWSFASRTLTDATLTSGSLATAANINTATTSLGAVINTNTNSQISSAISTINSNTDSRVLTASSSLVATIPTAVWSNTSRTLSSFGTLAADVWTNGTRTLTAGTLDTGSLATLSNLTSASTSLGSAISNETASVNSNTNSAILTASTSIGFIVASASSSVVSAINTNTDSQISSAISTINSNTDSRVLTASTSLASTIPTAVWANGTRSLTTFGTLTADIWNVATSTFVTSGSVGLQVATNLDARVSTVGGGSAPTAADIWSFASRTLTDATLTSGSLATAANLNTASSSLASVVNANTNSIVGTASTSIGATIAALPATIWAYSGRTLTSFGTLVADVWSAATRTLTSSTAASWSMTTSDFGTITAGSNYLATVHTVFDGTLTDSGTVPTVTLYDPSRNVVVSGVSMTRVSAGTYTYSYTTSSGSAAGMWEAQFSATVESGKTLASNDYWEVASSPAQVIINSISDNTVPGITANVTITNEGLTGYEYQYEWCVVSDINNACGGGDDVYHATAAKFINPGEDFNTTLSATVSSVGDYYFKTVVYFGTDSSGASRSFTAITGTTTSGGSSGGGGGGGSTQTPAGACEGADISCDGTTNSIDFSVLLYYWKATPPFANQYVDMNKDGKVDSVDFSIMLYHWGNQ